MVDTNTEKLQFLAHKNYNLDLQGALRKATGLKLDINGIGREASGLDKNAAFTDLQYALSNRALLLDGAVGSFASTPDAAALDILGDIDFRIELWDLAFVGPVVETLATRSYLGKWTNGSQQSYRFSLLPFFSGTSIETSTTGANSVATSPALAGVLTSQFRNAAAIRFVLDVDNGAAGRTGTLYTGPSLAGPWTQLSTATVGGVTTLFNGTAALVLGAGDTAGVNPFMGRITRMELRNGIDGTVVANPDFRALAPGTTSFADGTGKTWTLAGGAKVV